MIPQSTNDDGRERAATPSGVADAAPVVDHPMPDAAIADSTISERYRVIDTVTPGPPVAQYLAQRLDTGALVELTVLPGDLGADRELVAAFRHQAMLIARVSRQCSDIATVYECEPTASGALVLAMERPAGPTLREAIRREGTLSIERALRLAVQIARVLEQAHDLGLVHGGLSPENVVLVGPQQTVLTRFGFDGLLRPRPAGARSRDDVAAERLVYQAPEQASGQTTERSDIYAFGAILYEMLAGTPALRMAHGRRVDPEPLRKLRSEVTASLERIVMWALETAPDQRPASISVLCHNLLVQMSFYGQWQPRDRRRLPGRWVRRWRTPLVVSGGLAVIGALAIWFAQARMTADTSVSLKPPTRSAPMAEAPSAARAPAAVPAPRPEDAAGAGGAPGGMGAPRSDASGPTPAVGGVSESLPGSAATRTSPPERSPSLPRRQKPKASPDAPPKAATTPKPTERTMGARNGDRTESARPVNEDVTAAQRREAPVASQPERSREAGEDPGAIIDWLRSEGTRERR
jgi:serine/threonine protein kinase